jgi:hypothetical protein
MNLSESDSSDGEDVRLSGINLEVSRVEETDRNRARLEKKTPYNPATLLKILLCD